MRKKGQIATYKRISGEGIIRYEGNLFIEFFASNVINRLSHNIDTDQTVEFDVVMVMGKETAINISVQNSRDKYHVLYDQKKLQDIVKYNYENWEEIEKIVDEGDERAKKIMTSVHSSLDVVSSNPPFQKIDAKYIALAIFENKIKFISLTKDGNYRFLDEKENNHNIIYPSRFEEAVLDVAIEEFEDLINSRSTSENDFQKFFERNPDFILNDEYKKAHPHIILAKENNKKLIPDFVLEPVNQFAFCDLLELKLPSANIFVMKKNREHYSADITEAAAQLRVYSKYFNEERNRINFQQVYPHLKVYRPRMFLIIGRQGSEDAIVRRDIQAETPQLVINNFDDLLARMKWKKERLKKRNNLFQ